MKTDFLMSPDPEATSAGHFIDFSSGGKDSVKVNKFVPDDEANIVVSMHEFPSGIDNFSNYSFIGGVPHNDIPKSLRKGEDIRFIVLHETSGNESGTGFNPPFTAHFVVLGDNRIQQFNDLAEIEWHEAKFNNAGIGIEFANIDWEVGKGVKKDSTKSQQLKENENYLWAYWGDGYNIYKIPPMDRLERLTELVKRLLLQGESGFINVSTDWLQCVSYDDVQHLFEFSEADIPASDEEKDIRKYFIFSNGIDFIKPENFTSGICSHSCVSNLVQIKESGQTKIVVDENAHSDGSFLSLYTWLRIDRNFSEDDAYAKTKELLRNNMLKVVTKISFEGYLFDKSAKSWKSYSLTRKRNIHLVDVSSVI